MGFEVLLTPIAAALVILGAVVVLDSRTVFVKSIDVPLQLWAAGYSSQTLQQEIANSMLDVEREGRARDATRELALDQADNSIDYVTEYFELTPLVRAFQQSGGFVSYVVDGHVTQDGGNYVMTLDITARDGTEFNATVTHPQQDVPVSCARGPRRSCGSSSPSRCARPIWPRLWLARGASTRPTAACAKLCQRPRRATGSGCSTWLG